MTGTWDMLLVVDGEGERCNEKRVLKKDKEVL
jgi:hypothetical protein